MLSQLEEACSTGARLSAACETIGLNIRTIQRWRSHPERGDQRRGPVSSPKNKLSKVEIARVLSTVNQREYRNLSPKQIVPLLADKGIYLASESTLYRILRRRGQMTHRSATRPATQRRVPRWKATGPNQVYSWDITYIKSPIKGCFYYLYLFMDVWSRKIVGWRVEEEQSSEFAALLLEEIVEAERVSPGEVQLHADNGGPMKGATMLATLQKLGVVPSFSRPSVSNDNPYSESLFGTMKYRPKYPSGAFESIAKARLWVREFVRWYNEEHLHSGIRFVTPSSRHGGEEDAILRQRREVYEEARRAHPERWTGSCRCWTPVGEVELNGHRGLSEELVHRAA